MRHLVLADAAALPFRDGVFTLVTASMVAEHLERPEDVFAEVARVAAPGARFIVFTPNNWNSAMIVARLTPHWFHLAYKRLTYFLNRREWRSFEDDVFPSWYRANTVSALRRLAEQAGLREARITRHGLAHSFGFVKPLYVLSLLFERLIDRPALEFLKADILAIFEKPAAAP
ncbi:MAG: class I SAM-dependent methyltransferase [Candidatus Binatia bacterium]|nr:class I SAM-dependent methyltransferase [Candidatus Binatia bacterium]